MVFCISNIDVMVHFYIAAPATRLSQLHMTKIHHGISNKHKTSIALEWVVYLCIVITGSI